MVNFDSVPGSLKHLRQWCIRVGKQPFVKGGAPGTFSPAWGEIDKETKESRRHLWMTFEEAHKALQESAKCRVDGVLTPADGLGIIMARHNQDGHQLVGGDLDCCRDPVSGWTSPWAEAWLKKLATYTEVSPSGCGYRFFCRGDLLSGAASGGGRGRDDLTEEAKNHILTAKPTVAEKLRKGQIPWCNVELYTAGRHLTITGNWVEGYPKTVESRAEAVLDLVKEIGAPSRSSNADGAAKQGGGNRLPPLDILRVIDTTGPDWSQSGGQWFGPHPEEGSTTGRNLVVNPREGVYCWMHNGINAGGDSWIYLACECGAVPWDQAGPGTLKDSAVMKATKEHAIKRGLVSPEDVGLTTTTDREALKAAMEANPEDLAALKELSRLSNIGAAKLLGEAKLPKGVTSALVLKEADRLRKAQRAQPEAEEEPGPDPSTMEKALTIAKEGDPLRFLVWQAQRNHLGDINYQKVLICSIASAASLTSNGIQPGSTGDKGSGKSDACVAAYHLIPRDRILEGSLSPMSLLYLGREGRLKPGMVLFSDDVEYEPIVPIFKRSTSAFQRTVRHFTVLGGKEKRAEVLEIPPRFVWWLTSVESVANDQAFDRQYPISTDSSPGHKKRVAAEIANRRSRRETKLAEDEGVLVARALLTDIFDNGPFKVVIPQAEGAEWVRSSDFRGQEQFWDLVDALTILRWRQRQMDRDGYLMAEDVDVLDAKELMMAHKQSHVLDLTEAEIALVGVLLDGLPRTQKELCEALGLSQSTVSTRLGTIMKKSPAITEDTHQGRKTYQINKEFDLSTGYWENLELIRFKHDLAKQASGGVIGGLSVCYRTLIGIPIGIVINNSDGIPGSLSVITGGVSKAECLSCLAGRVGEKACEIYSSAKRPITNQNQQQEKPIRTDNAPPIEPITCQNQQQETSIEVDNSTDNASSKPHTDINEELAEADRTSPPTTSETGCKCDPSTFLKANVALTFASRDLQRFSALTLAGKSRTPPGEVLRFLQAARALGLAEVTELGTKRADRLDLWAWREPPPGPAGHKEGVTA